MALDFPANPTNGQAYGSYVYNSTIGAWQSKEDPATVAVTSPIAPASANSGDIWYNTNTGVSYVYYDDSTSAQWVEIVSSALPALNSKANLVGDNWFSGGVNYYGTGDLNGTFISSNTGRAQITVNAAAATPLTVKGTTSQTADLQQWQNSGGTVLADINSAGELQVPRIGVGLSMPTSARFLSTASASTEIPIISKGATSQTANLQEWQNTSSTVLSRVASDGRIFSTNTVTAGNLSEAPGLLNAIGNTSTQIQMIVRGAASQTANLQEWQNSSGSTLARVDSSGNLVNSGINWIMLSAPVISEFSFTGTINTSWTLNASVPTNARYILANVFMTASSSDHQNFVLSATQWTNAKNWVETRGQQPSAQFGTMTQKDHVTLTYFGEVDGFTSNYGIWHNSLTIPTTGRTVWANNNGNSGSNGWLYFVIRGYSL